MTSIAAASSRLDHSRSDGGGRKTSHRVSLMRSFPMRFMRIVFANSAARVDFPDPEAPETRTITRSMREV